MGATALSGTVVPDKNWHPFPNIYFKKKTKANTL